MVAAAVVGEPKGCPNWKWELWAGLICKDWIRAVAGVEDGEATKGVEGEGRREGVGGLSVFVRLMSARVSSPPAPPYRIHGLTDTPIDFTTRYMRIPTCLMTDRSPATRPPPMHLASLHRLRAFARHLDARKKSSLAFSSSTAGKIFARSISASREIDPYTITIRIISLSLYF